MGVAQFGDLGVVRKAVKDRLGVDKLAECKDIEKLKLFYDWMEEQVNSSTPFNPPQSQDEYIMGLMRAVDDEISHRDMPSEVSMAMASMALKAANDKSEGTLKSLMASVQSYPLKNERTADVVTLHAEISALHTELINRQIDGFETSRRLTNSVTSHLKVKKYTDCKDPALLQAYIENLKSKLQGVEHVA